MKKLKVIFDKYIEKPPFVWIIVTLAIIAVITNRKNLQDAWEAIRGEDKDVEK